MDYVAIKEKGMTNLNAYLDGFKSLDSSTYSDSAKTALYINFYNAGMIYNMLKYADANKIDVKSQKFLDLKINDLSVPGGNIWNGDYTFSFNGHQVNLDEIEHGFIRMKAKGKLKKFAVKKLDPRIHAAVNCAALSCPRLRETSYTPENIDTMLTENMVEWLNSDDQFRKVKDNQMQVNSIVIWYYKDFDDHAQKVLKLDGAGHYLAPFIKDTTKDAKWKREYLKEEFSDRNATFLRLSSDFKSVYDWQVSDIRNRAKGES